MNKIVHYIGLDVHKDSIAVAIAPQNSTEVRRYGIIGGTLDAVDKLLKRLSVIPNLGDPESTFDWRCDVEINVRIGVCFHTHFVKNSSIFGRGQTFNINRGHVHHKTSPHLLVVVALRG